MTSIEHPTATLFALSALLFGGCAMDNPAFDGRSGETRGEDGNDDDDADDDDGGDGDGDPNPGDGDAESSTGDGDGDGDGDGESESSTGDGDPGTGDGDGDPFCPEGLELCNGDCVNVDTNNSSCGVCGHVCAAGNLCSLGSCAPKRYVFTSSVKLFGDFGSISVANNLCNDLAFEAQLPGTYKAWLSDFNQSPVEMFAVSPGVFVLPNNGPIVAYTFQQLFSGQLINPINLDEWGAGIGVAPASECGLDHAVWTGTTNTGLTTQPNCNEWTSANGSTSGIVGDAASKSEWSDTQCSASCDTPLPVYCVQQ